MPNLAKDFHRLYKRIGRLTDGQASLTDVQWDDAALSKFAVLIQPNSGFFKGGSFKFEIRNLKEYNTGGTLDVLCISKIYHPNIDPTMDTYNEGEGGNVCLNLLDYSMPNMGLESVVLGILFLLHNPNFDDPLYDGSIDEETYAETIQNWLNGEEVEGMKYGSMLTLNVEDDYDNINGTEETEDETEKETAGAEAGTGAAKEDNTAGGSADAVEGNNAELADNNTAGCSADAVEGNNAELAGHNTAGGSADAVEGNNAEVAEEHNTAGGSADAVGGNNAEVAKENGNETESNEVTETNETSVTAADNTQTAMPVTAVDATEDLNAKIEAYLVAESASGDENEDECVCEDIELSLLIVDGEVLMTSRGLTVEPIDETTKALREEETAGNNAADANNTVVSEDDISTEGGETVEEDEKQNCDKSNTQLEQEDSRSTQNKLISKFLIAIGVLVLCRFIFKGRHAS